MRRILLLLTAFVASLMLHAQTDDQITGWIEQCRVAEEKGNYQEAVRYAELLRDGYAKRFGKDGDYYVLIVDKIAQYYNRLGNYAMAAERETEMLDVIKQTKGTDNTLYVTGLGFLANFLSQMGDNDKAVDLGNQAIEMVRRMAGTDNPTYATYVSNQALYNDRLGNFAKAMELEGEAMRIKRKTVGKNHPDYALSLNNMALFNSHLGNNAKAVELAIRAFQIFKTTHGEMHFDCATTLDNIAVFFSRLGQADKAITYGTHALTIYRDLLGEKHPDYATSLNNLASYHAEKGDYGKAIEYGGKAVLIQTETLGVKHPSVATSLDNLSGYYGKIGDIDKAAEMSELAAMALKEIYGDKHPDYAISLSNLSSCKAQKGEYTQALQLLRQSLEIIQDNILQQFASLPSNRRTNLWNKNAKLFTEIYPSLTYLSKTTTAPDLYDKSALFAKGLLLSTELEIKRLIQESGDNEALQMLNAFQNDIRQLQMLNMLPANQRQINTDSLARAVQRQERQLVKKSQAFGKFTKRMQVKWQDVQRVLKNDELAVEFLAFRLWNSDKTMVVALTLRKDDKEPKFIPLFDNQQIESISDQQYYNCPELTALVWNPLSRELKGIQRIYFSCSGILHNIGIEYAPGMENYEMFRLSSTREIIDMKTSAPDARKVGKEEVLATLFGGVDYGAGGKSYGAVPSSKDADMLDSREQSIAVHQAFIDSLPTRGMSAKYLPSTLSEVESIHTAFEKKHHTSSIHTGRDASETSVKSISSHAPHILHIATHGFYFTEKQASKQNHFGFISKSDGLTAAEIEDKALTRSGLLFAGANNALKGMGIPMGEDDGVLTAKEIAALDLRGLDLVVLSACKTGKGDIGQGEGVFGLQRGFKKAGAQSLIMSLWDVADEATQILMTSFYEHLLQGQSKRQAFKQAQQHLRSIENGQYDHPQFWASFILLD